MKWEEWLRSREAKRETLRRLGFDAPSRRKTSHSSSERRMRQAFGGERAPDFGSKEVSIERHEDDRLSLEIQIPGGHE